MNKLAGVMALGFALVAWDGALADGFGDRALGGQGGAVLRVTNLNDAGPGSLRACIDASGPRICKFEVAGTIKLNRRLEIANDRITIDGSSAPGEGITIRLSPESKEGGPMVRVDADDVILRHLRLRRGPTLLAQKPEGTCCGDNLGIHGANRVMVDHVSMQFSTDENLDIFGGKNITVQNSIIAYGLNKSTDKLTVREGKGHSKGILVGYGANNVSILNNLIALNKARGCRVKSGVADCRANYYYGIVDPEIVVSDGAAVNVINNVVRYPQDMRGINDAMIRGRNGSAYARGNDLPPSLDLFEPGSPRRGAPVPVENTPAGLGPEGVLDKAGAMPRDGLDAFLVAQVRARTGGLIDDPSEVVVNWWLGNQAAPVVVGNGAALPSCSEARAALKTLYARKSTMASDAYSAEKAQRVAAKNLACGTTASTGTASAKAKACQNAKIVYRKHIKLKSAWTSDGRERQWQRRKQDLKQAMDRACK